MGGFSNPFDVPLNSEIEESRQRKQANQSANGNPFDEPLTSEVAERAHTEAKQHLSDKGNPFDVPLDSEIAEQKQADAAASGQVTNDVGEQVIVPQPGESFADTVKRGVALGKQRQQAGTQQAAIDKETATIPTKTAQTLGAAAGIGAIGPALLAAPGELSELAIKHLAGNVLPGMGEEAAKAKLAEMAPKALQIVKEWALPVSAVGGLLKVLSLGGSHK